MKMMVKANARVAVVYASVLAGMIGFLSAGSASAQTTCDKDTDCPGTACGTQVCIKSSGGSACMDANTAGESGVSDGWCNTTDDCKCKSLGATCGGFFCTFTIPPDGGATGTGGSSSGGSTGTGGSATGTGGGTGSAGTSGGGGGDGGCSIAGAPSLAGVAGAALLAVALMRRRSRRRG
jgi:hypothetical protein